MFEALGDRSHRSIPLTEHDARELVDEPSVQVLLGEDGTDPARLVDLLQRVSALIDDVPEIRELRLDPILTSPEGIAVLGSQIEVGPVPTLADTGPRRLG